MLNRDIESVVVVGGGVAGLAAATALAGAGYRVELFERRAYPGGRASSYLHPALNEVVDCQHVLLGCCTNLIHLFEESGVADKIRWYDELNFLEPGGRASRFTAASLPAPLHFTPSFLRAPMLNPQDKLAIARGLSAFLRGIPADDTESLEQWLRRAGQTERALRHFWEPVVFCTLNDGFERCSTRAAAHVFRELFLKSPEGSRLGIPVVPLSELYGGASRRFESSGGKVHLRSAVDCIAPADDGRWSIGTQSQHFSFDAVVLALPSEHLQKLLPGLQQAGTTADLERRIGRVVHSPYTTIHLWFDRQISDLDHAALLDTTIQWVFHKSRIRGYAQERGSYVELVIAASRAQLEMERAAILNSALEELKLFFPEVKTAKLVKSGILKEARATFSLVPGGEKERPTAETPWPGVFLAGDWTATGWPATMEGAARSGYRAAEAVAAAAGRQRSFLRPDIAPSGWMRLFGG